ncbi:MAG: hypothetical protein WA716_07510, partial [Pseudolabrys sp.]
PKEYVHYDLHAWLFKNNPLGMFAPTNPDVNCEASDFFSARKADQDDAGAIERRGCLLLALSGHQLVRCLLLTQSGHHPVMPFPRCQGVGVAFLIRFDAFA